MAHRAPIAQLDRALPSEGRGQELSSTKGVIFSELKQPLVITRQSASQ
jgi:hypothetical protein